MTDELIADSKERANHIESLHKAQTLMEFRDMMANIHPKLEAWNDRYDTFLGTPDERKVKPYADFLQQIYRLALEHQDALYRQSPGAAGGKRWKMPRKMTRRYCKKTSCRKMGFTQKASCRPWKNCY